MGLLEEQLERDRIEDEADGQSEPGPSGPEITMEIPEAILHEALRRYLSEGLVSVPVTIKAVEFQPPGGVTYWSQVAGARVTMEVKAI